MTQKDVMVLVSVTVHKLWENYLIEFEYWKDFLYLSKVHVKQILISSLEIRLECHSLILKHGPLYKI